MQHNLSTPPPAAVLRPAQPRHSDMQPQPERTRKNLKEPESSNPRSSAMHWTFIRSNPTENSSPKNLKVAVRFRRTAHDSRTGFTQTRTGPLKIEQNRTKPNKKPHEPLPTTANPDLPILIPPIPRSAVEGGSGPATELPLETPSRGRCLSPGGLPRWLVAPGWRRATLIW